jgi:16S rRNA C967 or C1407 C5-methylase (RsmB/RsmF family)
VIDWILRKDHGKVELERISIKHTDNVSTDPLLPLISARTISSRNLAFHPSISCCMRVAKSGDFEGFFIAKLRRIR